MQWTSDKKINRSLKFSFYDGAFCCVMLGMTEQYLVPFALAMHASVQAIGALAAIPTLVSSWVQSFTTYWVNRFKSRKRFIIFGVFCQACVLLPMAVLAYLNIGGKIPILIGLAVLFLSCGAVVVPAWGSLMTDHVPENSRGAYFGWRNQLLGLVTITSSLVGGTLLYQISRFHPLAGFTVMFTIAMAARFVSAYFLTRMEDIPHPHAPEHEFTFWMFIRRFRQSNFVRFVLFVSSITFSANIAAPFFSVFMLRDLQFNYLLYTAVILTSTLTMLRGMRIWGHHADHVGNARVLRLTSLFLPMIPLAWVLSSYPPYLICIEVCSGFLWGGFNLAASNFIYDAVSPAKRVRCIGYFNAINGTALALGAVIGGYLASRLPPLWGFSLRTLFLCSGVFRLLVVIFLGRTFREVRPAKEVSSIDLFFSVVGLRPLTLSLRKE